MFKFGISERSAALSYSATASATGFTRSIRGSQVVLPFFGGFDVVALYAVPFAVNQQVFVRDLEAVVGDHIGVCALGVSFPRDGPLTVGVLATI